MKKIIVNAAKGAALGVVIGVGFVVGTRLANKYGILEKAAEATSDAAEAVKDAA